jgi:hypothetical protein
MKFRQKHKVEELQNWDVPEFLLNAIPYGTTGCDKEGSIVIIIPFKGTDAYGLFHASSKQEVVKYILRLAEGKHGGFWGCWLEVVLRNDQLVLVCNFSDVSRHNLWYNKPNCPILTPKTKK